MDKCETCGKPTNRVQDVWARSWPVNEPIYHDKPKNSNRGLVRPDKLGQFCLCEDCWDKAVTATKAVLAGFLGGDDEN